jgi:hypothetical protein
MLQETYAFLSALSAMGNIYSAGVAFADLVTSKRETQSPHH